MDGVFVPNLTFGAPYIESLRQGSNLFFDVHLMIENPGQYIDDFKKAGADLLTIHFEADTHIHRTLGKIKESGMLSGIALNPGTPIYNLDPILSLVDFVLLMSVNPGFYGQKFIPSVMSKLTSLVKMRGESGMEFQIGIDGGVNAANLSSILDGGADLVVSGYYVFKEGVGAVAQSFRTLVASKGGAARKQA